MNRFSILTKTGLLLSSLLAIQVQAGDIVIQFAEPDFTFIQRPALNQTIAKISPGETEFGKKIEPLLEKQEYRLVIRAFEERDDFLEKDFRTDSPALKVLRGQVYLSLKSYDKAERVLTSALKDMPDLLLAHRTLGMLYMLKKDYKQAKNHISRSIELGTSDAQSYGQLAYLNFRNDQPYAAIAGYQQAMYLSPDNEQWLQGLLYVLIQSRAWDYASALLQQQLATHSDDPQFWLMRGQIAMQQHRYKSALASLEAAIRLGDDNTSNLLTAVGLHAHEGSPKRAVALLSQSLQQLDNSNREQVIAVFDQTLPWLIDQNKISQAESLIGIAEKASLTDLQKDSLDIWSGKLALAQHDYKKAKIFLQKSVDRDPANGQAILALADVYRKLDQPQQAELYLVRATSLKDTQISALLAHAQLKIDQKDYQSALKLLRRLLDIDPDRTGVQQNIRQLEQLVNQSQYTS
ncbi:tetratricopeptide repeat protein [Neptunicella sp.]|uniref:tetratricopeptide repeat protein n=1 Tax=Neptunicella sp. TaxID=2125986 RepID=UPI003F694B66